MESNCGGASPDAKLGTRYGTAAPRSLPSAPERWVEPAARLLGCSERHAMRERNEIPSKIGKLLVTLPPTIRERFREEVAQANATSPEAKGMTAEFELEVAREDTESDYWRQVYAKAPSEEHRVRALREAEQAVAKLTEYCRELRAQGDV